MPLIRRVPKRGFNNAAFKLKIAFVNLDDLEIFEAGSTITEQSLRTAGLIRGDFDGLKVLGRGQLTKSFSIEADAFSASARESIERAGGKATNRGVTATSDTRQES